eukprot:1031803-Pyramimonas_sp.AAC.2
MAPSLDSLFPNGDTRHGAKGHTPRCQQFMFSSHLHHDVQRPIDPLGPIGRLAPLQLNMPHRLDVQLLDRDRPPGLWHQPQPDACSSSPGATHVLTYEREHRLRRALKP